jgi:hypothetical protein
MSRQLIDGLIVAKRELEHCSPLAMPAYVKQMAATVAALVVDHENRLEAIARAIKHSVATAMLAPPIL